MEDYKTYANWLEILNALFKTPWRSIRFLNGSWILIIFNFWCAIQKKKKTEEKSISTWPCRFCFFSFRFKWRNDLNSLLGIWQNIRLKIENKLSYANSRITHFLNLVLSDIFLNDFILTRIIQSYIRVNQYKYLLFN